MDSCASVRVSFAAFYALFGILAAEDFCIGIRQNTVLKPHLQLQRNAVKTLKSSLHDEVVLIMTKPKRKEIFIA